MRGAFGRFAVSLASKLLSLAGCIGVGGDWKSLTGVGDGRGASIGAGGGGVGSLGVSNGVPGVGWESMAESMAGAGVITCSLGACNGVEIGGGATGRTCGGVAAVSIAVAMRCICGRRSCVCSYSLESTISRSSSSSSRTYWKVESWNIRCQLASLKFGRSFAEAGTVANQSSNTM